MPGLGNYDDVIRAIMADQSIDSLQPQQVAQRFPSPQQLGQRVATGQMSREQGLSESDRIQAELLRRAIQGK